MESVSLLSSITQMSALNCDKEKAFNLNHDAGHCDSIDSLSANAKTNSSTLTVDLKNGDDYVKKGSLCDKSSVVLTAGSAGVKTLVPSTLVNCSGIDTSRDCFLDQSLSQKTGNDFFSEDIEVRLGYRELPGSKFEMDACSASQNKSGVNASVQLECNTSEHCTEAADSISHRSLQKNFSSDKEIINHKSKNEILQGHGLVNDHKQVLDVSELLTLKSCRQDDGKVVETVNKCSSGGDDSVGKVTMRRKRGDTSAAKFGPDAELSQVLQRRSNYLSDWEVQQSSQKILTEADRRVLEYEKKLEEEKARRQRELNEAMPVIVNDELSKIMNERKGVVDSSTSVGKQGKADDALDETAKSASMKPVLKLDSDVISVASFNEAVINSETNTAAETLNLEADMKVRCCEGDESLGSQGRVIDVDDCSNRLCSGYTSALNAEGVKVIASETLIRKSSWTPTSRNLFNTSELSPRQKTQVGTSA